MKNKNAIFSRIELVLGITEEEEFTIKGDISGTVWKLKKEVLPNESELDGNSWWSITDDVQIMNSKDLLMLIDHPEVIQSLDVKSRNSVFCTVNNSMVGITSQIVISLLLAASSAVSLLLNLITGAVIGLNAVIPIIPLLLGTVSFGYNCYKLGAFVSANREVLV